MAIFETILCLPQKLKPSNLRLPRWKSRGHKFLPGLRWLWGLLITCGLLTACSQPSLEGHLTDYAQRLARVLDQDLPEQPALTLLAFPGKREMRKPLPQTDIDLFEFLKLGNCELQGVIADKNSSLGRFAPESRALQQDIDFILLSETCLTQIDDQDLINTLTAARDEKLAALPVRLMHATLAGPEFRALWTSSDVAYPHVAESRLQGALSVIQTQSDIVLSQQDLQAFDIEALERALEVLRTGEAGALLANFQITAHHLALGTEVVKARAARRPLCFEGMRGQQAEFFRNVVLEKFVAGIQRDMAVLNQRYYEVIGPLQQLEQRFTDAETESYKAYREQRDAAFAQGLAAVKNHVDALQPLMLQCGFIPNTSDS